MGGGENDYCHSVSINFHEADIYISCLEIITTIREDFNKKTVKLMTLSKKVGGVRKKSNFECMNKIDILLGG